MSFASSLSTAVRALGHYIDQPAVIKKVEKHALAIGGLGAAALFAKDVYQAEPEDRTKTIIRDALVLGATLAGTFVAFKIVKPHAHHAEEMAKETLEALAKKYSPEIMALINKPQKTVNEFKALIEGIKKEAMAAEKDAEKALKNWAEDMNLALPIHEHPTDWGDIAQFAITGAASVLSGFAGGWAANKINGEDDAKTVNMMKEGLFQFIANIAMCAVGAAIGIATVNKLKLQNRLARIGIIGAGLSIGIFGGGAIANYIGEKWINPFFNRNNTSEKQQLSDACPQKNSTGEEKRSIEFSDAILHLDDVPTAMVFAGVEIFRPFIPLFFAFSGYRTGIGYRNDDHAHGRHVHMPRCFNKSGGGGLENLRHMAGELPQVFAHTPVFRQLYQHQIQTQTVH